MGCTSSKHAKQGATIQQVFQQVVDPVPSPAAASSTPGPAANKETSQVAETTQPATAPRSSFLRSEPAPSGKQLREAEDKPKIIFVIGGPGSGKGTQCAKIVDKYEGGCRHISSGDLLRAEVKKGTELGKEIEAKMKSGGLVSDDQVIKLLEKEISASAWFGLAYLVDGFPRAVPQAEQFERQIRPADLVLYFDCPEETMKERITGRGKSSGRQDDNPETVKERLQTFQKQSLPVVDHYAAQNKLKKISAVPSPDEVFVEVAKVLEEQFSSGSEAVKPESAEVQQWRTPQVLDMEKRFYGNLQDQQPGTDTGALTQAAAGPPPSTVKYE